MSELDRRTFVARAAATAGAAALGACRSEAALPEPKREPAVIRVERLPRGPWPTDDPFLFCAHHDDAYPKGDARMAPAASLAGRDIGMDFSGRDGWSMYHGDVVPGFPRHPHRGFETVTLARKGFVDHSDSLGATARFGKGDVQWMTAGKGIVHAEMFPLRSEGAPNPLEMFQIWLNLPAASKMVEPHFTMMWGETVPQHRFEDDAGRVTTVTTVAKALEGRAPPAPPPDSWAARPEAEIGIWTLELAPGARWTVPAAKAGLNRSLYVFDGRSLRVDDVSVPAGARVRLHADRPAALEAGPEGAQALLLEGRPIGEPVAQHGPFVMNTRQELQQAYLDFQRTGFGGWPWPGDAPVHPRSEERFAIHADGRRDAPKKA